MANEKRLIDANALLSTHWLDSLGDEFAKARVKIIVQAMPTVDAVEVVHGRWIDNVDENGFLCNAWLTCSVCRGQNWSKKPNYCPNCGAKMDGDGNG